MGTGKPDRSKASRERLYKAIEVAMEKFPDLRVGQLFSNLAISKNDLYYIEDDQIALAVYSYVNEHS